jgi:hypothetical protein
MDDVKNQELNHELNIVFRYLLSKEISRIDAEDVVQEAAYKYLMYYESIKSDKLRSWLIRVALKFYYDQCRKQKRITLNFNSEKLGNEVEEKLLPEKKIISNENKNQIERILCENFIERLENLNADNIVKDIKNENNSVHISGAVVVGSPKELQRFQELNFIRASTIGVVIEKY